MKFVITGAPCSGKTRTINKLKKEGFKIYGESARNLLKNKSHKDRNTFQRKIWARPLNQS